VEMEPREHDEAVAVVSHVPQVMASLTAAQLVELDDPALALVGQGLRDVTRIAASDPHLWSQIIGGNADAVVEVLDAVADDLADLRRALTGEQALRSASVRDLVTRGNVGRSRIPGKHGAAAQRYAFVAVVIPDEPGGLARLFDVVGALGVNIEDLALEHSPGQPVGLATLAVQPAAAPGLMDDLSAAGWVVHR
jgi:prephenate dehydrogenase